MTVRGVVNPFVFLGAALALCLVVLWLRPEATQPVIARIDPTQPGTARTAPPRVPVDPRTFDRYIGRYRTADDLEVAITRDGSRLFARVGGGGRFELVPVAGGRFYVEAAQATVRFDDNDGPAAELRAETLRGTLRARRID